MTVADVLETISEGLLQLRLGVGLDDANLVAAPGAGGSPRAGSPGAGPGAGPRAGPGAAGPGAGPGAAGPRAGPGARPRALSEKPQSQPPSEVGVGKADKARKASSRS